MTNYSENPSSVRFDFYKVSGKWYMTEAWDMSGYYQEVTAHTAVRKTLEATERGRRLMEEFIVIVAEPYHMYAHPIILIPEWARLVMIKKQDELYNEEQRRKYPELFNTT